MDAVLSVEEVRRLEDLIEKSGTSKAELMEAAGEALAKAVMAHAPSRALILAGFGNNGGDGWVAADILSHEGVHVDVVTPVEPDELRSPLARHVARRTAARDVSVTVGPSRDELSELVEKADVVVDALLGTGFHGEVRVPFSIWIDVVNSLCPAVISADVPSGVNADTGEVAALAIRADKTVTMLAAKVGLYSADAPEFAGDIEVAPLIDDLGDVLPDVDSCVSRVSAEDFLPCMVPLPNNIDKYSRGSVLVVAGSAAYPGAAMMAAKAAARAGAGYVAVAAPDACANLIRMALPSIPVIAVQSDARGAFGGGAKAAIAKIAGRYDCVLAGCGMTTGSGCVQVVSELLQADVPLVLDADALNCLAKLAPGNLDDYPELYRREAPLALTPHYRELSRLVGGEQVEHLVDAIEGAQKLVWASGSSDTVVVAKGPTTAVVGVERAFVPQSGPNALATAGSGDVLAGIAAGIMATTRDEDLPLELVLSYAVNVHSEAGHVAVERFGDRSVMATDLPDCIGEAYHRLELAAIGGLEAIDGKES